MRKRTTPPKPPTSTGPRLRLTPAEPRTGLRTSDSNGEAPVSYKFPVLGVATGGAGGSARSGEPSARLVAAKVNRAPVERRFTGSDSPCALVHDPDVDDPDCAGRIVSSRDLVRQIEQTLDRMQSRLNDFRTQVDAVFMFPTPPGNDEPDRPRAA